MANATDVTLKAMQMAERAFAERDRLRSMLKAIIAHWDEFGPEHGFDEIIDRANKTLSD